MKRERGRTSPVASCGRRYFRVIVSVIVNSLSHKQLHLIRNPLISCHVTRMRDYKFYVLRAVQNYEFVLHLNLRRALQQSKSHRFDMAPGTIPNMGPQPNSEMPVIIWKYFISTLKITLFIV
jgi:hypothetical protein